MEDYPAAYFDQWYSDMEHSPTQDEIERRHLGLPAHFLSTSLLTWAGIAEVTELLRLGPGDLLLDLACGRGGYGLEIAERAGARLVGVDYSQVAIRQAGEYARSLGRAADFRVGSLDATGLADGSVDAVLVVDAIQFSGVASDSYAELRRVLRPGGRIVLTTWEAVDPDDEGVPERIRRVAVRDGLLGAGFGDVHVVERADWREQELAMWREAAALDPAGDPALQSFRDEGVRVLERPLGMRRVLGAATA